MNNPKLIQLLNEIENALSDTCKYTNVDKEIQLVSEAKQLLQEEERVIPIYSKESTCNSSLQQESERKSAEEWFRNEFDNVSEDATLTIPVKNIIKMLNEFASQPQAGGYSKEQMNTYCYTALFAGRANGSLSLEAFKEVVDEWLKENIKTIEPQVQVTDDSVKSENGEVYLKQENPPKQSS